MPIGGLRLRENNYTAFAFSKSEMPAGDRKRTAGLCGDGSGCNRNSGGWSGPGGIANGDVFGDGGDDKNGLGRGLTAEGNRGSCSISKYSQVSAMYSI